MCKAILNRYLIDELSNDNESMCHQEEKAIFFDESGNQDSIPFNAYFYHEAAERNNALISELIGGARIISIGCHLDIELKKFAHKIFGEKIIHKVDIDDIRGLSTQIGHYEILIILYKDSKRVKRVMRGMENYISSKLCFAISSQSTPRGRSELLKAFCDDVFDKKSDVNDIYLRITSMYLRRLSNEIKSKKQISFEEFCEKNVTQKLKNGQYMILRTLFENSHRTVRYSELSNYDLHKEEFRVDSLKVRVHHLKKKIKNYEIKNRRGIGYQLVKCL